MNLYGIDEEINPEMGSQGMHFYPIPGNLNIRALILSEPVKGARFESKPDKQVDRAVFILGLLSTLRFSNWEEYENDLSYVRICSSILNRYVKNYKKYLQYFMDKGIIESNESYQENGYCKGYRFTDKYRNILHQYKVIKDPVFYNRISHLDRHAGKIPIAKYPMSTILEGDIDVDFNTLTEYPNLAESLLNLSIDMQGATKQLEDEIERGEIDIDKANKRLYYFNSVLHLKIYFTKDTKGGRLHTTITSFPKDYRKYLRHPKVQNWGLIDVKNCQPFLLGTLMYENNLSSCFIKNKYIKEPIMLPSSFDNCNIDKNKEPIMLPSFDNCKIDKNKEPIMLPSFDNCKIDKNKEPIMLPSFDNCNIDKNKEPIMLPSFDNLPEDAKEYITSCSQGTLYEDLAKKIEEKIGVKCSRNEVKKKVVPSLFEPIHWTNPKKEVFKSEYPSVSEFVRNINGDFKVTKRIAQKSKDKYLHPDENKLAILLQRAESHIILDHVVKQIGGIDKQIPILTIHDALMVPEEKMGLVLEAMETVFQKMTNMIPKFDSMVLKEPSVQYKAA